MSYGRNRSGSGPGAHFPQWRPDRFNETLTLMKEYLATAFSESTRSQTELMLIISKVHKTSRSRLSLSLWQALNTPYRSPTMRKTTPLTTRTKTLRIRTRRRHPKSAQRAAKRARDPNPPLPRQSPSPGPSPHRSPSNSGASRTSPVLRRCSRLLRRRSAQI